MGLSKFYTQEEVFHLTLSALLSQPNPLIRLKEVQQFLKEKKEFLTKNEFDRIVNDFPFLKKQLRFRVKY